ncbi:DNA polymerase III subunit beta [Patescibacteria group bacterium]|nr:DNA polymerase III subunit beta [Patescibacteria group bacterium]MBU4512826.1 DNA polymerase III subunit beta [Patescibacteria group bacterium]MCG2693481.1 DNA polymerase III subunit beta [Candidatus Parcubacteria bacterium]
MKFSCLQENLNKGLSLVSRIASGGNTTLPILSNVLLEVAKSHINLKTTNLEIGIQTVIRGKVEEEGRITVPAQLFANYINLLPNKQINLNLEKNDLLISCENQKTKIKVVEATDFPIIPGVEKEKGCICKKDELKQVISQVAFTIIPNETRPEISGALLYFNGNKDKSKFFIVGTDSYRLAEKSLGFKYAEKTNQDSLSEQQVIVPHATLQELTRVLDQDDTSEEVEIYFSENQILFSVSETELISRIISGKYPDYKQIIPENFKTKTIINTSDLIIAVKGASLFAQSGMNDVNLKFIPSKNQLVVSSVNSQTGENIARLKSDTTGEENTITFNYHYLLDGLQNIGTEQATLEIIDSNSPGLIKPIEDESYLYVIMPIKQ